MTHVESMSKRFANLGLRVFIALTVAAGGFAPEGVDAQNRPVADRPLIAVEVRGAPGNVTDTVRITGFRVDGISYDLAYSAPPRFDGAPRFDTTPDWYERLEIIAQNKSNKTVWQRTCRSSVYRPAKVNGLRDPLSSRSMSDGNPTDSCMPGHHRLCLTASRTRHPSQLRLASNS